MELPSDDDSLVPPAPPDLLPEAADPTVPPPPTPQMRQLDEATAAERDEVRRLVDAGATSPEDLRLLAEKIRDQREREQQVWQAQVKPSLRKSKKRAFTLRDLKNEPDTGRSAERKFLIAAGASVLVVLLVLTMSSAPLIVILVLLAALLAYAYLTGRKPPVDDPSEDAPSATDAAEGEPDA